MWVSRVFSQALFFVLLFTGKLYSQVNPANTLLPQFIEVKKSAGAFTIAADGLKANYFWPAMWGNSFNEDDPLSHAATCS